jgi:5-methylcytosine-specific restriction endonuclease McrA
MFGGDNSLDNLQPAHQSCNSRKGASQQAKKAAAQNLSRTQNSTPPNTQEPQQKNDKDFFTSQTET